MDDKNKREKCAAEPNPSGTKREDEFIEADKNDELKLLANEDCRPELPIDIHEELFNSLDNLLMNILISQKVLKNDIEREPNIDDKRNEIRQKQMEFLPNWIDLSISLVNERDKETDPEIDNLKKQLLELQLSLQKSEKEREELCGSHAAKLESIRKEFKEKPVIENITRGRELTKVNKDLIALGKEHQKQKVIGQRARDAYSQMTEIDKLVEELQNHEKRTEILKKLLDKSESLLKHYKIKDDEKTKQLEDHLNLAEEKLDTSTARKNKICEEEMEIRKKIQVLKNDGKKMEAANNELQIEVSELQLVGVANRIQKDLLLAQLRRTEEQQQEQIQNLNSVLSGATYSIALLDAQLQKEEYLLEIANELKCCGSEEIDLLLDGNSDECNDPAQAREVKYEWVTCKR